jgi:hypothetical protein
MPKNLQRIEELADSIRRCGTVDHEFFEWLADERAWLIDLTYVIPTGEPDSRF